jgi:hypothetical protein
MKIAESNIKQQPMSREIEVLVLEVVAQEVRREVAAPSTNLTQEAQRVGTVMRRILTSFHSLVLVSSI